MKKNISKDNLLIAEFLGFEKVRIGYFGMSDQTKWQVKNEQWLERNEIDSVGWYIVNVKKNKFFEWNDVAYHKDWNWLMPAWFKFQFILTTEFHDATHESQFRNYLSQIQQTFCIGICEDEDILTCHHALVEGIEWYNKQIKK